MQIDQYESQFKSAVKEVYQFGECSLKNLLLVGGASAEEARLLHELATQLVPEGHQNSNSSASTWTVFDETQIDSVRDLLEKVEAVRPDLVVVARDFKSDKENLVYGLSNYVDTLTQVCREPVLLLPKNCIEELSSSLQRPLEIMVQTNHLTGDNRLINWGVHFASPSGELYLIHIEDDLTFNYYEDIISKIPEIHSDHAMKKIRETLIKLPTDFIDEVKDRLGEMLPELNVEGVVRLGHRIEDYRALLDKHKIDLLIINTKVEGQLAMSGNAYSIAVEFRETSILLL